MARPKMTRKEKALIARADRLLERWDASGSQSVLAEMVAHLEKMSDSDCPKVAAAAKDLRATVDRGRRGGKRQSNKRGGKKGSKKGPKSSFAWQKHTKVPNVEIQAAPIVEDHLMLVVARPKGKKWRVGYWTEDLGMVFFVNEFDTVAKAKKAAETEGMCALQIASDLRLSRPRVANREVGDVVLAARQYQRAVEDRMAAMDRGTPDELARATKRERTAKEALEDMTGANRELLGAIGGAAVGGALGALLNPVAAAIGALAVGAIGSVVARPSLPSVPSPTPQRPQRPTYGRGGAEVIPFTRRPTDGRAANPLGTLERLPKATRMWEAVYESSLDRGFSEQRSAQQAWGAVKGAGYHKDKKGVWRAPNRRAR